MLFYKLSLEYIKPTDWVLDIASGSGWGSYLLSQNAKFVTGVDISHEAVDYARTEYQSKNLHFTQGSILNIPFPDETFDVVNSIETFEHVKRHEAEKMISECYRVLKKGGLYLFSTPDHLVYPYQPKTEEEYVGFHFWHYTRNELESLLQCFPTITFTKATTTHFVSCLKF